MELFPAVSSMLGGLSMLPFAVVFTWRSMRFPRPGRVDGRGDDAVKVRWDNGPNKQDLDVVLDRDELGIGDARFTSKPFFRHVGVHLHADGSEAESALPRHREWFGADLVDDAMLLWLDARLRASLLHVREDGPGCLGKRRATSARARTLQVYLHARGVPSILGDDDEASNLGMELATVGAEERVLGEVILG